MEWEDSPEAEAARERMERDLQDVAEEAAAEAAAEAAHPKMHLVRPRLHLTSGVVHDGTLTFRCGCGQEWEIESSVFGKKR